MIREVTFALDEKHALVSGNRLAKMHHYAAGSLAKRQRRLFVTMIADAFARRPCRVFLPDGRPNTFRVTLTRIMKTGTGFDGHDNLRGAFKCAVDSISAVIARGAPAVLAALNDPSGKAWKSMAGRDDGKRCFEWLYEQQRSTDLDGARIRIEDLEEGDDLIVLKDTPALLGAAARVGRPGKPVPLSTPQQQLLFRPAWLALPWLQRDPDADEYENLVEADAMSRMLDAPEYIELKDPRTHAVVRLYRHHHIDPELGGRVWLYCNIKPAAVASGARNTPHETRTST